MYICKEKYRLNLKWASVAYDSEGICKLNGAFFSGPVLDISLKVNPVDFIMLDFFRQYRIFVKSAYVARLSWENVEYSGKIIKLCDAVISHNTELNRVPKFNNTDYIVIDTEKHEEKIHAFNLVYDSYVVNENDEIYKF